jgi:hypothetical protein
VAVSENPLAILDHVNSTDVNLPWRQDQSSDVQVSVQSYQFHSLFSVREPARGIFDEYGQLAAVNMWIGDSGMMNFRRYFEPSSVTVNRTLTPADMLGFGLDEQPLGSAAGAGAVMSDITMRYGYQYHLGQYDSTMRAFPGNNAACNSVQAAGITRAMEFGTEHIMNTDTASFALQNVVRFTTQGGEYASVSLPFRHCDLELYDVLTIQHPLIVGSEGTYQVVGLEMDVMQAMMKVTAGKVLSL